MNIMTNTASLASNPRNNPKDLPDYSNGYTDIGVLADPIASPRPGPEAGKSRKLHAQREIDFVV
jgi:hypothetical protein